MPDVAAEAVPAPSRAGWSVDRLLRAWAFLILGGALFTPYVMVAAVVGMAFGDYTASFLDLPELVPDAVAALPLVLLTGLLPTVPELETSAVRMLLRPDLPTVTHRSGADRGRAALWYTLHAGVGGLVAALTLAVPVPATALVLLPFVEMTTPLGHSTAGSEYAWGPPVGVGLLAAVVGFTALAGRLLAGVAPALLGPSAADRLTAEQHRRTQAELANLAARDLHDGLGHTLSVVTLQAAAARTMLDRDPEFAGRALAAIEDAARVAAGELDQVLGLLRSVPGPQAPALPRTGARAGRVEPAGGPTLADVDALVARSSDARQQIRMLVTGDVRRVPDRVSGHAYRILQEGLTNALRHAGPAAVQVRVGITATEVELEVVNPLPAAGPTGPGEPGTGEPGVRTGEPGTGLSTGRARGGNGLRGVRDRVDGLGGTLVVGGDGDQWRFVVRLPWEADR
jgi:signal transduction histidine kinase